MTADSETASQGLSKPTSVAGTIYVWEDSTLDVFGSSREASEYVEAVDVVAGVYDFFDGEGRRLRPVVDGGDVRLELSGGRPDRSELLRRLRDCIDSVGVDRFELAEGAEWDARDIIAAVDKFFKIDL